MGTAPTPATTAEPTAADDSATDEPTTAGGASPAPTAADGDRDLNITPAPAAAGGGGELVVSALLKERVACARCVLFGCRRKRGRSPTSTLNSQLSTP